MYSESSLSNCSDRENDIVRGGAHAVKSRCRRIRKSFYDSCRSPLKHGIQEKAYLVVRFT